jgi:quercetin dioxygenase-like cupin family protein
VAHVLRLFTDTLAPRATESRPLPPCPRVLYIAGGMATIADGDTVATLSANSGLFNTASVTVRAGADGAKLLRYELVRTPEADHGLAVGEGIKTELTLEAELVLDGGPYLMRLDKVELPPGGIAYLHVHQGGGIRYLLLGGFLVETEGRTKTIAPGEAWFERGPDPVLARAPKDKPAAFARVMILPRTLIGKSSIRYLDPEDQAKPKPQRYTIYVDQPIELP